jgi:hypothetical protein
VWFYRGRCDKRGDLTNSQRLCSTTTIWNTVSGTNVRELNLTITLHQWIRIAYLFWTIPLPTDVSQVPGPLSYTSTGQNPCFVFGISQIPLPSIEICLLVSCCNLTGTQIGQNMRINHRSHQFIWSLSRQGWGAKLAMRVRGEHNTYSSNRLQFVSNKSLCNSLESSQFILNCRANQTI